MNLSQSLERCDTRVLFLLGASAINERTLIGSLRSADERKEKIGLGVRLLSPSSRSLFLRFNRSILSEHHLLYRTCAGGRRLSTVLFAIFSAKGRTVVLPSHPVRSFHERYSVLVGDNAVERILLFIQRPFFARP